ncbi:MAG TPA: zinc-finger domain-containing protein [Metalysinibacillus jejuensis]|uniref:Zinc-finger domain-containing protein n=1 Tax=Metalysinibacillus jejuensis TaxID=914327 RepID=A0A921NDF2_9BACL|nr:zinc-finger domain-containing protein [Metalysinibacillus jejuensis]HJH11579.1 zinc-finger domain-containing protein [Metalysinibacillus jejuensis]
MITSIVAQIDHLHDTYCRDCPVKQALREERGKKGAHDFCIHTCSVGKKIQQLGGHLTKS